MKLHAAKICINCDEIFEGNACPSCGEDNWAWLRDWIQPLPEGVMVVDAAALDRLQQMAGLLA